MAPIRVQPVDWSVLQVIQRRGATPQYKLAEHIGRQRSTVNGAVKRLLKAGWLETVGQAGSQRGRPPILLAVNKRAGCFAGVDIAADELHCALLAADGTLLEHVSAHLPRDRRPERVIDQIDLNLRGVLSRADMPVARLLGLWAGVAGPVDENGVVVTCASLGWRGVPLGEMLGERFHCEVLVQGGSTAMNAAAEALMGAGRNTNSLVYYHAGRGISARYVQRGNPLAGATQRAGEFGHVVVEPGGPRCACGNRGCLEAVASGPAIARAIARLPRRELPAAVREAIREHGSRRPELVVAAAYKHRPNVKGHPLRTLLDQCCRHLAMGAAMAVAAYDPELLVLGGYLLQDNTALRKQLQKLLPAMVLDWRNRNLRVVLGEVVTQDRAVGGAAEVCQRFWANPRGVVALR